MRDPPPFTFLLFPPPLAQSRIPDLRAGVPPPPPSMCTHAHTHFAPPMHFSIPHHHSEHLSILSALTLCPWGFGDKGQQLTTGTERQKQRGQRENVSVWGFLKFASAGLWFCATTMRWDATSETVYAALSRQRPQIHVNTTKRTTCSFDCADCCCHDSNKYKLVCLSTSSKGTGKSVTCWISALGNTLTKIQSAAFRW